MRFIAIDLEMEQPSNQIISVGVAWQQDEETLDCVNFFIRPDEPLSEFIKDLTGYKGDEFNYTETRKEGFMKVREFLLGLQHSGCHNEFVTWGCGDVSLLREELIKEQISPNFVSKRFIDLKTLLLMERVYDGKSVNNRMALKTAMSDYKVKGSGTAHNSMYDAYDTLDVFCKFTAKKKRLVDSLKLLKELL